MAEIAASSAEQLSGIEQVSGVVTQMDRVVQQNAALVAESAASAAHLSDLADHLMESVASFKLDHADEAYGELATQTEEAERHPMEAVEAVPAADYPRLRAVKINEA